MRDFTSLAALNGVQPSIRGLRGFRVVVSATTRPRQSLVGRLMVGGGFLSQSRRALRRAALKHISSGGFVSLLRLLCSMRSGHVSPRMVGTHPKSSSPAASSCATLFLRRPTTIDLTLADRPAASAAYGGCVPGGLFFFTLRSPLPLLLQIGGFQWSAFAVNIKSPSRCKRLQRGGSKPEAQARIKQNEAARRSPR